MQPGFYRVEIGDSGRHRFLTAGAVVEVTKVTSATVVVQNEHGQSRGFPVGSPLHLKRRLKFLHPAESDPADLLPQQLAAASGADVMYMPAKQFLDHEDPKIREMAEVVAARQLAEAEDVGLFLEVA